MKDFFDNRLLMVSLGALILYWTLGAVMPNGALSVAVSASLFVFGAMTFYQYTPDAFRTLFLKERSNHASGAHLATYGVWLLSFGAIWVGLYTLVWYWFDQPESWIGTAYSAFGRAMISGGFFLMYVAPERAVEGIRISVPVWIAMGIAAGLALGAAIGFQWAVTLREDPWVKVVRRDTHAPVCPPDMPVWISKQSNRYHTVDSPYRDMVVPVGCYGSEEEAKAAGFKSALGD